MITKISNKPSLSGRNRRAHIHRKLMMPPDNAQDYAAKLDAIDWSVDSGRKKTFKIRVNGKVVYNPTKAEK